MGSSDHAANPHQATTSATILARLRAASLRARRFLVLRGGLTLAAAAVACALATLLFDLWLRPGPSMRAGIGLLLLGALIVLFWRVVMAPARIGLDPLDVAAVWDRARGRSGDRLVQAVGTLIAPLAPGDLAALARERASAEVAATDFEAQLDVGGARRRLAILVVVLAVPAVLAAVAPVSAGIWARRWLLASDEPWPQDTWLEIADLRDGRLIVAAREPFTLRVSARAGSDVPESVELEFEIDGGERRVTPMTRADANAFSAEMPAVTTEGTVWLRGGDDRVGPVALVPRERPEITGFELAALAPGSTKPESRRFATQEEDLRFLEGSRLTLDLEANEDLAGISTRGNDPVPFQPGARGPRGFRLEWTHPRAISFAVEVESAVTGLRSRPRDFAIGVFRDTAPRVMLECAGIGDRVTPSVRLPCRLDALDDIGIASARFGLALLGDSADSRPGRVSDVPVPLGEQKGSLHVVAEKTVELRDLMVMPGRRVRIVAAARDTRHPESQEGISRAKDVTVVPPEILLAEIVLRLQAARARFRTALNEARELRDQLQAPLAPEGAATVLKRFRVGERTLGAVRRSVGDGVREMSLNRVLEEEGVTLLEKTVVEPFAALERGLLKEQRDALEAGAARGLDQAAAAAAQARQVRIISGLESILKGMDRWDTLVDLVAQLGEVIRLQTDARRGAESRTVESRGASRGR